MSGRILLCLFLAALYMIGTSSPAHAQFFRIVSCVPKDGATDVPLDTPIMLRFNYSLNTNSLSTSLLYEATTARNIPCHIIFGDGNESVTLIPRGALTPNTQYVIALEGIQSSGSAVLDTSIHRVTFTTVGGHLTIVPFVTPAEVTLPPGGFTDATYSFIESGGGLAEILQIKLVYEDSNGREISKTAEEVKLPIPGKQTTRYKATIAVPKDVGNFAMGQTIMVRRIFVGVDHEGNRVELRTGTKVNVMNPVSAALRIGDAVIKVPEYGMMIPKDSIIAAEASIKGAGSGDIHGSWALDGQPLSFFVAKMNNGEAVNVQISDRAFAQKEGIHTLSLQLISPEKKNSEEISYIVCTTPSPVPVLLSPSQGAVFSSLTGTPPVFRWSLNPSAASYRIAVGKSRTFKPEDWIRTDTNRWTPDWVKWSALGQGTFYWSVKPVLYNNQEGPASEASSFTLKGSQ